MMDMNSGYNGYSMSKRATEAYENDEMPKSKWTKAAMINAIGNEYPEYIVAFAKKMKKNELFDTFFYNSSWHHTSKYCNRTDFYSLIADLETVERNFMEARGLYGIYENGTIGHYEKVPYTYEVEGLYLDDRYVDCYNSYDRYLMHNKADELGLTELHEYISNLKYDENEECLNKLLESGLLFKGKKEFKSTKTVWVED